MAAAVVWRLVEVLPGERVLVWWDGAISIEQPPCGLPAEHAPRRLPLAAFERRNRVPDLGVIETQLSFLIAHASPCIGGTPERAAAP